MAGTSPQLGPCRPLTAQRGKKQQRAPVAQKAPRPEEQDPRVKCKNCLAFGHKANSVRCPMKRWGGALAPQPLGPKQMKENRKPWTPRDLRAVGPPNSAARETEQRSRLPYVTSHTTGILAAQGSGQDSNLGIQASGKRAALPLTQTSENPQKKPRLSLCLSPKKRSQGPERSCLNECSEDLLKDRTITAGFQVKCKNCLGFGHKAKSVRCPMKRWDGALAPQPLGPKQMKENRKPWTPRDLRAVGPPNSAARENEQRSRDEEQQRQALVQRFPRRPPGRPQHSFKDQTEPCDYVRRPNRPTLVHTTQSKHVAHSSLTSGPPTRLPYVTSQTTRILAAQGLSQDSNLGIQASGKRAALTLTQTSQNPHKKPRLSPCLSPKKRSQEPEGDGKGPSMLTQTQSPTSPEWDCGLFLPQDQG
ncbi:protein FAM90A12-like [Saccopteryx leptura]|uniref:protein FAM90A12-like n=1 Tax=Saccopteryx leptura TaxID=249018 RepID=UPI00339C99D6